MSVIDFESMCEKTVKMEYEDISAAFQEKSEEVLEALRSGDHDGTDTYVKFMLATVAADGTLALEEYFLLRNMFDHVLNKRTEFDDALWYMMDNGLKDKSKYLSLIESMKTVLSKLDDGMRAALVELSVLVCAADGVITDDEKSWIRQIAYPHEDNDPNGLIDNIMSAEEHSDLRNRF